MPASPFLKYSKGLIDDLNCEVDGLELLRSKVSNNGIEALGIPEVLNNKESFIELEYIQAVSPSEKHYRLLAKGIAKLHNIKQPFFGYHIDNYIGLNVQANKKSKTWGDFFSNNRLLFQLDLIRNKSVRTALRKRFSVFESPLIEFLNDNVSFPSLLHGDLWRGNVLFGKEKNWLIDPAVYFGDREADIAMTELFGGFTNAFYQEYDLQIGLTVHYPKKRNIYNLYHILNHYNLFGEPYLSDCFNYFELIEASFIEQT